jgi:hypothetical protein
VNPAAKAWEGYGYGKHEYRHINPDDVNVEDYARDLRGEEEHFGDVREYNSGANNKHPENNVSLDDLCRIGTVVRTDAPGLEGVWMVVQMPVVIAPKTYARLARINEAGDPIEESVQTVSCIDLGCAVDDQNLFPQVCSVIVKRGSVGREQRERLTKK